MLSSSTHRAFASPARKSAHITVHTGAIPAVLCVSWMPTSTVHEILIDSLVCFFWRYCGFYVMLIANRIAVTCKGMCSSTIPLWHEPYSLLSLHFSFLLYESRLHSTPFWFGIAGGIRGFVWLGLLYFLYCSCSSFSRKRELPLPLHLACFCVFLSSVPPLSCKSPVPPPPE